MKQQVIRPQSCMKCDDCNFTEYEAICTLGDADVGTYVMEDTIPLWCPYYNQED